MKTRILALLICLVMTFSLWGCNFAGDKDADEPLDLHQATHTEEPTEPFVDLNEYDEVDMSAVDFRISLYSPAELTKGYESLKTEDQKKCYRLIDEYAMYVSKTKSDNSYPIAPIVMEGITLSEAQLHLVLSAYSMDHPHIFWLDSKFAYYSNESVTYLQLNSGLSAEDIELEGKRMGQVIEEIFDSMPASLSSYEKEIYLHDEFLDRCEYADKEDISRDDFRIYTSLGGLVDNYAVCEGYSRSMQILLSLAGIETYYVFGEGNDNLHMWNVINLDGVWYHLDATWNDGTYGASYDHFNLSEEEILADHTLSPYYWELTEEEICGEDKELATSFNIFIPETDGTGESYYSQNSTRVTGFDETNLRKIAKAFTDAMDRGEDVIYLYLDPEYLVFSQAVDNLLYSGDYAIFDCIEIANSQIYYAQINDEFVETTEIEEENILCIYFDYE